MMRYPLPFSSSRARAPLSAFNLSLSQGREQENDETQQANAAKEKRQHPKHATEALTIGAHIKMLERIEAASGATTFNSTRSMCSQTHQCYLKLKLNCVARSQKWKT